ncbi:MAG: MYXO-CTERM sorting domain-containing protein [Polyangiaceae bacterium]|nr:MYXO-CTERM sorting domain-containing protein [Polyangiaceae bacterium]
MKCPVDACHDAAGCDPATGQCSNPPKPDGTPCPGGACQVGICTPNGGSGGPTVTSSSSRGSGSSGAGGAGGTAGNDVGGNGAITSSSSNGGPPDDSNGCSCKTTGGSSSGAAAWLALGLLAVVRRRQNDSRAIFGDKSCSLSISLLLPFAPLALLLATRQLESETNANRAGNRRDSAGGKPRTRTSTGRTTVPATARSMVR